MSTTINISKPFDPSQIEMEIKNINIGTLIQMLEGDMIDLQPAFQRSGNLWSPSKKSQLIESLILGLPLPSFYFSHEEIEVDGVKKKKWAVIDGLQRLCTLMDFMVNKTLTLSGLDFLEKKFGGFGWDDFAFGEKIEMQLRSVTVNVLKGTTPPDVKYILFQRLNSKGTPLNPQEIRNALNQGRAADFLRELSELPLFLEMVRVEKKRMTGQEYALRFVSLMQFDFEEFSRLDAYLSSCMSQINKQDRATLKRMKTLFESCLSTLWKTMGLMVFRNPLVANARVSKALFDALMVGVGKLNEAQRDKLIQHRSLFMQNYIGLFHSEDFKNALGSGTGQVPKMKIRLDMVADAINKTINSARL
nr:DUF262 domain-containing protein [Bacteroides sp.]